MALVPGVLLSVSAAGGPASPVAVTCTVKLFTAAVKVFGPAVCPSVQLVISEIPKLFVVALAGLRRPPVPLPLSVNVTTAPGTGLRYWSVTTKVGGMGSAV